MGKQELEPALAALLVSQMPFGNQQTSGSLLLSLLRSAGGEQALQILE